jgi:hypothetical protein
MENQELIAKYKRQLQNPSINEEVKSSIRKKLEALEGGSQPKETPKEKEKKEEEKEGVSKSNKERIDELKKIIDSDAPEIAKKRWRKELEELEGKEKAKGKIETKPKPKPKPKSAVKPKVAPKPKPKPAPKPKVTRKVVKDKPVKPKVVKEKPKVTPKPKVAPKPIVKKKPKFIPKAIVKKKTSVKKVYEPKVKTLAGEPDCDTLLKQFRARRRKSKEAQKQRKTTPIFRKISVDVVDAVEKAIKNVPAQQIKESPKETIRKFGVLKKLAQDFLNAFKDVLGKEFNKSEAKKELDELTILIDKLNKKYTSKK